jgi:hypothetical protein
MSSIQADYTAIRGSLINLSKDKAKLTYLYENYPDMFEQRIIEVLSVLVNKTQLSMVDVFALSHFFECNLVKSYINLPTTDPNREVAKNSIELFLEAVAKYYKADNPRSFVTSFLQLAALTIKLNPSLNYFTKAHASVVTVPKAPEKNVIITSDIQQIHTANLYQLHQELRNTPTESFVFAPQKRKVTFECGLLLPLIKAQLLLQNKIQLHNWNNGIQTENFLKLDILENVEK